MKIIVRLSLFIFFAVNLILGFEIFLRITLPRIPEVDKMTSASIYNLHPKLVFENVRSRVITESKYIDGAPTYVDVKYTFDKFGRRLTVGSDYNSNKSSVIFFGSSIVFGKGIEDKDTLPSYFAQQNPDLNVYNYAVRAWGTQQYLELMRLRDLKSEVTGTIKAILFLISVNVETGHVQRLVGSMDLCTPCWWMKNLPHYKLNQQTRMFEFTGTFDETQPIRYYLYMFLQNLRIVRYFRINFSKMTTKEYLEYAKLLNQLYEEAHKKFPEAKIFFVNHPFSDVVSTRLLADSKKQIEFPLLDYCELIPRDKLPSYYFGTQWPYPKPKLNETIARQLSKDLLL